MDSLSDGGLNHSRVLQILPIMTCVNTLLMTLLSLQRGHGSEDSGAHFICFIVSLRGKGQMLALW